jgi:hypothetical protein
MNDTIEHLDNGDFKVVRTNMTPEALEADKPKFNADDKEAKKLFQKIQAVYDKILLLTVSLESAMGFGESTANMKELVAKCEAACEEYDDLVDIVVQATHGQAPAYWTDPMSFDVLEATNLNLRGKTYNEMAEIQGHAAFGD